MEGIFRKPGIDTSLQKIKLNGVPYDIKILVGGITFTAHKIILCSNSLVLRNILTQDTDDKYKEEIELKWVDPLYFAIILLYMYENYIKLDSENITDILRIADYLEMDDVRKFCLSVLERFFSPENALNFFQTSHLYNDGILKEKARDIIFNNFLNYKIC